MTDTSDGFTLAPKRAELEAMPLEELRALVVSEYFDSEPKCGSCFRRLGTGRVPAPAPFCNGPLHVYLHRTRDEKPSAERSWTHDPDTGCSACPLFDGGHCAGMPDEHGESGRYMTRDERHPASGYDNIAPAAPTWCPLREGIVIVRGPR